jgi:hypothetical protein
MNHITYENQINVANHIPNEIQNNIVFHDIYVSVMTEKAKKKFENRWYDANHPYFEAKRVSVSYHVCLTK